MFLFTVLLEENASKNKLATNREKEMKRYGCV